MSSKNDKIFSQKYKNTVFVPKDFLSNLGHFFCNFGRISEILGVFKVFFWGV
jgi:hypothetical protein